MSVDRLYRNLMNKLINANIDLDAYLQLRKAKGYMSVSENDHLRDNVFELCHEMRQHAPRLQHVVAPEEKDALRLAGEAVASAAVSSGCGSGKKASRLRFRAYRRSGPTGRGGCLTWRWPRISPSRAGSG